MSAEQGGTRPPGAATGLAKAELGAGWLEGELAQARRLLTVLERELVELRGEVAQHRGELSAIEHGLATVSGRTERHEAGQQLARDARREVDALRERLEEEAALRRELAERLARVAEHDSAEEGAQQRTLEALATRVVELEERQQAAGERERRIAADLAGQDADEEEVSGRLAVAERELAAEREAGRRAAEEVAQLAAVLPPLHATVEALVTRARTLGADQRRIDDDVATLRSERERESELLEVVEQQRAARHRLEERVAELEERLVESGARFDAVEEDRALVRRELAGGAERLRALSEALEGHRLAIVEHERRRTRADEDAARRRADELDREVRVARELLVRLSEGAEQVGQEQPL
jgi:chromosome segregation ATPase